MVYRTRPDKGWAWVVMMGSFGAHLNHGFFGYAIGILNFALLERFQDDVGKTAWASGIFLGLFSMSGPVTGIVINRWSCRISMMIGSVLMTIGFVLTAFVDKLDYVIITYGVISGFGAGLCYTASVVVVGFNFVRHRNLASGFASSGGGVGTFALAPIIQMAKDLYGYSGLFLMCGGLAFHHFLFGMLCMPSYLELKAKGMTKSIECNERKEDLTHFQKIVKHFHVLRNIAFLCIVKSLICFCLGCYLMYVHLPSLVVERGTSEEKVGYLLSVAGICNGLSRLLVGIASNTDNINELLLYSGSFSLLGLAGILFPFYSSSFSGQTFFAALLGIYAGSCFALFNTLTIRLVGIQDLATAFGIEMFGAGVGSLIGPPLAGKD
ncbi:hypothetical protein FSP39_003657 [Pinctada imbricata]|uniref:Major facilitator superfamily (MFS) profile domain-containing protein n=1 Tax=Pinctada imbricata TaxID=66713 RepID=A0AA88YG73_PINIB|nr:hypothetical protein FSP39_003657 [Pinctada imbricata]